MVPTGPNKVNMEIYQSSKIKILFLKIAWENKFVQGLMLLTLFMEISTKLRD